MLKQWKKNCLQILRIFADKKKFEVRFRNKIIPGIQNFLKRKHSK